MSFTRVGEYRDLHRFRYGVGGSKLAPYLIPHIRLLRPRSVIDYGCGKGALLDAIADAVPIALACNYDPAVPAFAARPDGTFDLLVSVNMLEHVPEPELDAVLSDMRSLASKAMLIIDIRPATAVLTTGENAHAIVKPPEWWRERLARHWSYLEPFHAKPRQRARFKTWPTPTGHKPMIRVEQSWLVLRRRVAKRLRQPRSRISV